MHFFMVKFTVKCLKKCVLKQKCTFLVSIKSGHFDWTMEPNSSQNDFMDTKDQNPVKWPKCSFDQTKWLKSSKNMGHFYDHFWYIFGP